MSTHSLPTHLKEKLHRLRADPEFLELLRAIRVRPLPRFKPSQGQAADSGEAQKNNWIFASGVHLGRDLILAEFGLKPSDHQGDDS